MKLPTSGTELFQLLMVYVRIKAKEGKSMLEKYVRQAG